MVTELSEESVQISHFLVRKIQALDQSTEKDLQYRVSNSCQSPVTCRAVSIYIPHTNYSCCCCTPQISPSVILKTNKKKSSFRVMKLCQNFLWTVTLKLFKATWLLFRASPPDLFLKFITYEAGQNISQDLCMCQIKPEAISNPHSHNLCLLLFIMTGNHVWKIMNESFFQNLQREINSVWLKTTFLL